ncbi:MAG: hypothetical protein ABJA18_03445 [bacterium]
MSATQQRELAGRLAVTDPKRALATAQAIEDPWFACQALAWVARFAPDDQFLRIIKESLGAGQKATDPYRIVAAAAWPIRAIVEREHTRMLPSVLPELLLLAKDIDLLVSRSEALFLLFQAVFPAGREYWFPALQSLREASTPLVHWRQRRNLGDTVLIVWNEDAQLAAEMIDGFDDPKVKKQIEKAIVASKRRFPRRFFWTTAA